MGKSNKVAETAATAVVGVPVTYVAQRAIGAWGVLDPVADAVGKALKMNVTGEQAAWTIAAAITILLYAVAMWFIWRKHTRPEPATTESSRTTRDEVYQAELDRLAGLAKARREHVAKSIWVQDAAIAWEGQPQPVPVIAKGNRSVALGGYNHGTIETGDKIYPGKPPVEMTDAFVKSVLAKIDRSAPIELWTVEREESHTSLGDKLAKLLKGQGVIIAARKRIGSLSMYPPPKKPIHVSGHGRDQIVIFDPS